MEYKQKVGRRLFLIAALVMLSGIGEIKAEAAKKDTYFVSGELFYKVISNGKVEVCGTKKTEGTLVIPGKVYNKGKIYTVTGIADHELYYQDIPVTEETIDGQSVDIGAPGWGYYRYDRTDGESFPNDVEWLSETRIQKLVLPSTLTYIGEGAFGGCEQLQTVTFAKKYNKLVVGKNAFFSRKMKKIVFPEGTYELKDNAAGLIPEITIPSTVKKIGSGVVNWNTKKVTISKNNKKFKMKNGILYTKDEKKLLGVSANAGKNIKISNKTTSIAANAFYHTKVKTVALNKKITRIPKGAFANCSKLVSVTGTDRVTEIGYAAFKGCIKLTDIGDISNLKTVGRVAFWNDRRLTLSISSNMDIDKNAFSGAWTSTVIKLNVPADDSKYAFVNGLLIKKEGTEQIVMMQKEDMENIEVPEGVTEVAVRLGGPTCRNIRLPISLKVQNGTFVINGGTITFQNPTVLAFHESFTIRNEGGKAVTTVIVPKGCMDAYKTTMDNNSMQRIDAELFQDGYIEIKEQ